MKKRFSLYCAILIASAGLSIQAQQALPTSGGSYLIKNQEKDLYIGGNTTGANAVKYENAEATPKYQVFKITGNNTDGYTLQQTQTGLYLTHDNAWTGSYAAATGTNRQLFKFDNTTSNDYLVIKRKKDDGSFADGIGADGIISGSTLYMDKNTDYHNKWLLVSASLEEHIQELQTAILEAQVLYDAAAAGAAELSAAIEKAQSFLTSESPVSVMNAVSELRAAIFTYKVANASAANPLDLTYFIANPDFETYTGDKDRTITGWTKTGPDYSEYCIRTDGGPKSGAFKSGNGYFQYWSSGKPDFSISQNLSGLPNGKYILTAAAGGDAGTTGTYLYAGSNEVEVTADNDYSVSTLVLDGTLTVGFKSVSRTVNWAYADNFRLSYVGQYSVADYADYLKGIVLNAQKLLTQKMQNSAKQTLEAAIVQAQQAATANPPVSEDISAAKELLETAIETVNLSVQSYAALQTAIDYAGQVLEWYADEPAKITSLQTAVATANVAIDNPDLTTAELNKAISDLQTVTKSVDKKVYIPAWMMGDVNDPENSWNYTCSKQSKNWILFWEKGYGDNPASLGSYTIDIDGILSVAEKCFDLYADSLKFTKKGSSKTDTYKMIIRLRYTTEWEASGSGVDDRIGLLTLTAWSANNPGHTVAHEVGHCFQYQVHCDNNDQNGWMYGFGDNASGGCAWWENCAQWQAFKLYPSQQFTDGRFTGYMNTVHKHILHEAPRYDNYFIHDYWCSLHGMDIIGRLWNESKRPEDPVDSYKRITGITQDLFNDEMYDCAAKFASWDIPHLKSYGASKIASRPQPKMNNAGNNYWIIDSTVCVENYGHNIIKLNAPSTATTVYAYFEGKAGIDGFRKNNTAYAGWRYGFVALKNDGTRVYSEMKAATMTENDEKGTLSFDCPANCQRLWFVVSGAPKTHWKHAWDDNDANDEQWPYQVRFGNTNLSGYANVQPTGISVSSEAIVHIYGESNTLVIDDLPFNASVRVYNLLGSCLSDKKASGNTFTTTLPSGIYIVNVRLATGSVINRKIVIKQ
jgi:hypothetical protein